MRKLERAGGRERVAKRRAALRAQGLRPKQFWVADTRSAEAAERARRDCEMINASSDLEEALRFVEELQHWPT